MTPSNATKDREQVQKAKTPKLWERDVVNLLVTKNIDLKQRRVVNASDSQDARDYTTQQEVKSLAVQIKDYIIDAIKNFITFDMNTLTDPDIVPKTSDMKNKLVASSMVDTKDNLTIGHHTVVQGNLHIDRGSAPSGNQLNMKSGNLGAVGFLNYAPDNLYTFFDCEWYGSTFLAQNTTVAAFHKNSGNMHWLWAGGQTAGGVLTAFSSAVKINLTNGDLWLQSTKLGFFNSTPVTKQVLNAYSTDPENAAYSGLATGVGGSPYASVANLNSLRVAYENLRIAYEDLRSKLQASTLLG